jgi:hypothetical protein
MRLAAWASGGPSVAADASPFAALSGQDIGVTGVGVAPAQVLLELAGQHGVVAVIRAAHNEGADRTELRLDRVGWSASSRLRRHRRHTR